MTDPKRFGGEDEFHMNPSMYSVPCFLCGHLADTTLEDRPSYGVFSSKSKVSEVLCWDCFYKAAS